MKNSEIMKKFYPDFIHLSPVNSVQDDGSESIHYGPVDNHGHFYSREYMAEFIEKIRAFYALENIDEFIAKQNKKMGLVSNPFGMVEGPDGFFSPPENPKKFKKFDPAKRAWSCSCTWCGSRISSKIDKGYFSVYQQPFSTDFERACSDACADLIWRERFRDWVAENGYKEFFNLA